MTTSQVIFWAAIGGACFGVGSFIGELIWRGLKRYVERKKLFNKWVCALLSAGASVSGRDLRRMIGDRGVLVSGPRFYVWMSFLEQQDIVAARYESKIVEGEPIRERHYWLIARKEKE